MNIDGIKRRLNTQTRNGRRNISVSMNELFELIPNLKEKSIKTNITMDVDELQYLVEEYERNNFKKSLKVEQFDVSQEEIKKVDKRNYDLER